MRKLTISLLSLGMTLPAMAQELLGDVDLEEPEIRRYTVEVIVFRYAQDVSTGSEVFPPDEPGPELLPFDEAIDAPIEIVEERPLEEEPEPLPDTEFVLLDEADFQLDETMGRMERLEVYEPVMHFGWTQATWPEEQTEAISLHRFARPPADLDGNLTLYLSRYLHLVVDLQMEAPYTRMYDREELNAQPSAYYRIQENRILKNGELRYYDHPKFGVLAKVTRVEDEEEENGTTELLGYGTE